MISSDECDTTPLKSEGDQSQNRVIFSKYCNPSPYSREEDRPIIILNNLRDDNISNKTIGGSYTYDTDKINEIQILWSKAVFDCSLVELTLSVPEMYKKGTYSIYNWTGKTVNCNVKKINC